MGSHLIWMIFALYEFGLSHLLCLYLFHFFSKYLLRTSYMLVTWVRLWEMSYIEFLPNTVPT